MANYFDQFDSEEEKKRGNFFDQFDGKKPPTKEEKPAPFSITDTALSLAEGAVGATKGIAQAFGAENVVAEKLGEAQKGLTGMISPARIAERERRAQIEKEAAESGDTMKEIGAFLGGVKEAPIQSVAQAAGSIVPAALATVGAVVTGAPAAIATAVGIGAKFVLGALQGAGEVKGSIYENVERELIASGVPKDEARKQAIAAQDYLGKNIGNIATGTAIGTVAGGTGVESAIAKKITGKVGQEVAQGLTKRTLKGAVGEALPEGVQAGQQQYASNVALTREGIETPAFQGVLGSAARDAVTSALLGGGVGALTSRQKAQVEDAKDKAEETGKPQEVTLQLPYNKDVTTGTYGTTTIIVNPDGSTQFPSEKNQFRPSATADLTEKGLKEKYTPQRVEDILSGRREVYASEEDRAKVESYRAEETRRSGKYMKQLDDLIAKRKTQPKGEALKAAQSPFNTVMDNNVLASFGIGPTAKLRKEGILEGLDIRNPEDADRIKSTLELYKEKASAGIKTKIEEYLKRPEFTGIEPEVAPTLPVTPNTIAFIPRGASEVKTYAGDVIKKGDKYFVEYDRGEGRKDTKELDPARILVNPTPDEIELMNLHKEITRLSAEPDVFKKFLMRQGIAPSAKQDLGAGDLRVSPFFRKGGQNVDQLASRAIDEGLLVSSGDDVQDTANMIDMISEALAGRYVLAGANAENYGKLDSLYGAIDRIVERGRIPNEQDIAEFIADEERQREQDRAVEEMYLVQDSDVTDFELAQPTPEELQAQELARTKAVKAEEQAVAKADKEAKEARAKKEIAQASEKAVGQFELGKTAEENLSGQKDIFVEAPKVPKSTDVMGKPASWVIVNKETGEAVMETFEKSNVEALNTKKYKAVPIAEYLASVGGKKPELKQAPVAPKTMKSLAQRADKLEEELKVMPRESMNEFERELMEIADKVESYGEKAAASGMRSAVKTGRIKADKDLEFYRKREQEYAARAGKAKEKIKEEYNLEKFSEGYDRDLKRLAQAKGLFATETTELVQMADEYIQKLTDAINEKGYKVLDVNTASPKELVNFIKKMSDIAGSVTRLLKEQEHLDKRDKFANENKYLATIKVLTQDFKDVDTMVGEKENKSASIAEETDSPEFKKWFGKSKMVSKNGKPEVLYHGTIEDIAKFYPNQFFTFSPKAATSYALKNQYEQDTRFDGESEGIKGANILPVYIRAEKPASADDVIDAAKKLGVYNSSQEDSYLYTSSYTDKKVAEKVINELKKQGFDSIFHYDYDLDGNRIESLQVFDPKGIKSVFNDGQYSFETAEISKSLNKAEEKKGYNPPSLYIDNPGGDWLKGKREQSIEAGKNKFGNPARFGSVTGSFRGKTVLIPVNVLASFKGINAEQQNVRQKDLEAIKKIMSETGRLPQHYGEDYAPFINVYQDGTAYVNEGNHRIMAAKALGFKYLPVEISYFNGGEQIASGDLPPKDAINYDMQANDDGLSLDNYSGLEEKSLGSTDANKVAKDVGGDVVYQRGEIALVRGYSILGQPVYLPVKGVYYGRTDVDSFSGKLMSEQDLQELRAVKKDLEDKDAALHKKSPFITFKNGFAKSEGVPANLAGVLNGWKEMLGLKDINIYVTTIDDAKANKMKFTGPHRVIGSSTLDANDNGSMRRMRDGSYYIAFNKGMSRLKMLETLAHELGHVHEKEAYMNSGTDMRHAIRKEYEKWLDSQKGKTARQLVDSLRARATAKTTAVRAGSMADNLTPYWKSFSEWYADQVSRWATTSEKPVTQVEKFFDKLARAIRNFFNKIKNAGYLPNETFKQYLDDIASKNIIIETKPTDAAILEKDYPTQGELFSRTKAEEMKLGDIADKTYEQMIKDQFAQKKVPFKQRFEELRPNMYDRLIKGLFDEFRFIKKYSPEAYMKARLSKAIDGALEGLLYYGQVKLTDGALDVKAGTKGLVEIYKPLGNEVDQYQIWKALNRDARMPADKRSFDDKLVAGRAKLVEGEINGKPRVDVYREVLKEENALNKSVLDVAKEQGLIDEEAYKTFSEDIYYIPFYKVMEESDNIIAISAPGKLTGQYFSKKLKGGEKQTNDLMENVLMNWSHILSAAMKNKAGVDTLKAAEAMGAAEKVKSTYDGKDLVKVIEDGKQAFYAVNDPDLVDSISLISYMGPKSAFLDVAKGFTNALRFGVTLSPAYKLRNLIRDSIQSASVSEVGLNVLNNVRKGLALSDRGNPTFMSALIGGGVFEMGVAHEGDQAKLIKRLIDKGVKPDTILDDPKKIKDFLGKAYEWYNEQGNRFENANRLALYDKLRKEGKTHLEASYAARDLMDFSLQGSFRAIKVVSQVVPFFNARLQGLYKLGRDGVKPTYRLIYNMSTGQEVEASDKQKAQRFMAVTSSVMLASMLLYMQFKDDEDFKRREDWDRDNFWWFKVNDVIFRVPKPFEIGAAGTLAERTLEQIMDDKVEGKVFADRLRAMLSDTFSLNPTPQVFKPLIDLYANKDSFTGAPIESAGMERLSKQERYTDNTSALAKALGGISEAGARILTLSSTAEGISPVQMDYAIKAYFGWAGSTAASISDKAVQPWSDVEKPGKPLVDTVAMGFVKTVPETQSKYVTAFYDNNKRINQAFADMKRYAENGEMEKVAKIIEEKGDLIRLQGIYDKTSKQLAEYRKYEQAIARDKTMPKEEKELEIRRIKLLISDTVKTIEEMRVGLKQ
jgi:hypothetical protein